MKSLIYSADLLSREGKPFMIMLVMNEQNNKGLGVKDEEKYSSGIVVEIDL